MRVSFSNCRDVLVIDQRLAILASFDGLGDET